MHSRKGSGIISVDMAESKNGSKGTTSSSRSVAKGTAEELGIPPGAIGKDLSQLPLLSGPLKKQSRRGKWQTRHFRAINHYLVYYASSKMQTIRCVHDVVKSEKVKVTGRFGYFEIEVSLWGGGGRESGERSCLCCWLLILRFDDGRMVVDHGLMSSLVIVE